MYLSAENRIYKEKEGKWIKIDLGEKPYKLRNTYVKSIKQGPGDTMWLVTPIAIVKLHSDTVIVWPNEEIKDRQNEVKDVEFDSLGNPWLIFELNGGIMFIDESTGTKKWLRINSTNSDLPDEVSCIGKNKNGNIYLGTDSDGLFKYLSYTPGSIFSTWPANISFYPSYSNNGIFFVENSQKERCSIQIFDLQGKLIFQFTINASEQTTISLRAGVYVVALKNDKLVSTKKIISVAR